MFDRAKEAARLRDQVNFLGYEFLTWLFLLTDRESAKDDITAITKGLVFKSDVSMVLGQRLVTCLLNHKEQKTTIISPLLEDSHEIFASLKNGHVVEALSLNIFLGEITISVMLHAHDFAFTQIKIKNNFDNESLSDQDEDLDEGDMTREEIFLRIKAIEDMELIINAFFAHFWQERVANHSAKERLKCMRDQVENRLDYYLQKKPVSLERNLSL